MRRARTWPIVRFATPSAPACAALRLQIITTITTTIMTTTITTIMTITTITTIITRLTRMRNTRMVPKAHAREIRLSFILLKKLPPEAPALAT